MKGKMPFGASLSAGLKKTEENAKVEKARTLRRQDKGKVSCTVNLHPDAYKRLQEIKITRGTSLQGLFEEALDVWLASIGETKLRRLSDK